MIKKIGIFAFVIYGILYLIGSIFSDEEKITIKSNDKISKNHDIKYIDLPIKEDLSYFVNPQNFTGQEILRIEESPLSDYEKGLEFGSDRNIRKEKLDNRYFINRYRVNSMAEVEINSSGFSEFEIDDFEKNLKEEFKKVIHDIKNNYKNVDKHIRIVNLNIPIKYSKDKEDIASVEIENIESINKLNYNKSFLLSDFVNQELNNEYISQFIKPTDKTFNFGAKVEYNKATYSDDNGFKIKADPKLLNDIGKVNKGHDVITELTLHTFYNTGGRDSYSINFVITSFKLKSSDKRFVTNNYINLIDTIQSFGEIYYIQNDDVKILTYEKQ